VTHDWGTNMVTIKGNDIVKIIFISKYLNGNIRQPQMIVSYNFMEGVTDEKEEMLFFSKLNLFSIGMITFPDEVIAEPQI